MENKEKIVIKEQVWTVNLIHYSDGTSTLKRTNDGFNPLELLGLCELSSNDIRQQIAGEIKPTTVERNFLQ